MKVLIISGGNTSERKIALISARGVRLALAENNISSKIFDLKKGYSALKTEIYEYDVIFPVLHGSEGEDGTLYQFLRSIGIPYVGSEPEGAKVAFDKILSKRYFEKEGIPTGRWKILDTTTVTASEYSHLNLSFSRESESKPCHAGAKQSEAIASQIRDSIGRDAPSRMTNVYHQVIKFGFQCVLKAAEGGSSREVEILRSEKDLKHSRVQNLLKLNNVYIEELLVGTEITVGVLEGKALPPIEIVPPEGKWFDFKNKYSGETQEIVGAPSVDTKVQKQAQNIALKIHKQLNLGPYSRTDFIIVKNVPYVLEVNTPCGVGFTPQSLFPKAAQAIGLSFAALCVLLVEKSLISA
jgi:D-alanine-D-alanine ligase